MAIESKHPVEKHFHKITKYHLYFFTLLFLTKVPVFWHVLSLLFTTPPMTYTCEGINGTNPCPCAKPIWNHSVFTQTVQTKYNIYCDKKWMVSFTQSMLYVGTLIGAFSFGFMSDNYGRLSSFLLSCLTVGVAGCLVAFMPSAIPFIILRCIEGVGVGGAIVTSYVLLVEYCGVSYREAVTALFHIPLNVSHMSLAGVSYLVRNSDDFQLVISVPVFATLFLYCLADESPKWLLDNNRLNEATVIMEKIAKYNNTPAGNIKSDLQTYAAQQTALKLQKVSFWHIFRYRRLTINLCCMAFIYFTCGMGYYGVSQYIGQMSGDIHSNVAMSGGLLIPGTCIAAYSLQKFGRRSFLMTTSFLSGTLMIAVILIPENAHLARVLVACIGCSVFFMSFIIVFLYGVELFPTTIRNSVLGFLSVMSRVGQIAAPPINSLPQTISGATFGTMAIVGGFLCLFLPETKNTELPSTLEETRNIAKR
ncbi:solute carrier family 22 member 3-like [Spodoptera litura]|uniref:Solute carrier family 22 member 3-like n=1 Tax=Spodoptera litura TaxID=69820 RepID=A0A9J7IJ67_SPOLT|nr:solute carrier family 22 member 3-like [Spodoptera litura]